MPPSPALRYYPGKKPRAENHRHVHSLESGLFFQQNDDDLALFNEMENRERDNFLLHTDDDFDDLLSRKMRYFSDFKLGISIPIRGENSDLLNADGEKNDYDWLLTPPDTPLFPSLDDETPSPNLVQRGRPRTQPISISRSTTMEKSCRSSRSSASPHRLSPSPRSGSSTFQSRRRPFSASQSSPTPVQRPLTPSRRTSISPNKPSTPAPGYSSPTPLSVSTGSSGTMSSSSRRETSPLKTSCGNSASPKLRSWHANLPDFSSDAPPNLRTSLADRPASYVRGSSPASNNGRDSTSRHRRQSISPTASRSASSSYSHDRDRVSSHSKGSVALSGDDDIDSPQSVHLDLSTARKAGASPKNRTPAFSKKPAQTLTPSYAPKRSSNSALRQMDHQKGPRNMFRPLLSSVPTTTFYVGKASSTHRPVISRDGSPTIGQGDLDSGITTIEDKPGKSEEITNHSTSTEIATTASESFKGDSIEIGFHENLASCSKCGRKFCVIEPMEGNKDTCPDCSEKGGCLTAVTPETTITISQTILVQSEMPSENRKPSDELENMMGASKFLQTSNWSISRIARQEKNVGQCQSCDVGQGWNCLPGNSLARLKLEEEEQCPVEQQVVGQTRVGSSQSVSDTDCQYLQDSNAHSSLKIDVLESLGTSVLRRSSGSKGTIVQGRALTAINIPYDGPSFAKENVNGLRSSIGHGASASSSVDLSSFIQTGTRVQRQLSCSRLDMENHRHDLSAKSQSTELVSSGISNNASRALTLAKSTNKENFEVSIVNVEYEVLEETPLVTQEQGRASKYKKPNDTIASFVRITVPAQDNLECTENSRSKDAFDSEMSSHMVSILLEDTSVAAVPNDEDCVSSGVAEDYRNSMRNISDVDVTDTTPESFFMKDDAMLNHRVCTMDVVEASAHSSLDTISGEQENDHESLAGSETDAATSPKSNSTMESYQKISVPTPFEKDELVSIPESNTSDHAHAILEESTATVESLGGNKERGLSFEEANDAILFCSSIVHNLALEAASIGMENENSVSLENSRPMVTILEKSSTDRKEPRSRNASKRTPKHQKARQRRVGRDTKIPSPKTETEINTNETLTYEMGLPNKVNRSRPRKLKSRCSCTVM